MAAGPKSTLMQAIGLVLAFIVIGTVLIGGLAWWIL